MTDGLEVILFLMEASGPIWGICRVDEWAHGHEYSIDGWAEVVGYYVDGDVYQIDGTNKTCGSFPVSGPAAWFDALFAQITEFGPVGAHNVNRYIRGIYRIDLVRDPSDGEANLMMDLVRVKGNVFQAQKALADLKLREHEVLSSLLRIQAETVEEVG
ncbi:hypothetical protein EV702DRAFT_1043257 [Suillus placidus]|uniref:Uncharacterized protein n=1 Tax=Suillus placidus TaxID=48579 RepID=A0A9P7D609_9AGAM|nr:hypothetical protein EV702DRAFT_1043257 [Suillus placidus]